MRHEDIVNRQRPPTLRDKGHEVRYREPKFARHRIVIPKPNSRLLLA